MSATRRPRQDAGSVQCELVMGVALLVLELSPILYVAQEPESLLSMLSDEVKASILVGHELVLRHTAQWFADANSMFWSPSQVHTKLLLLCIAPCMTSSSFAVSQLPWAFLKTCLVFGFPHEPHEGLLVAVCAFQSILCCEVMKKQGQAGGFAICTTFRSSGGPS